MRRRSRTLAAGGSNATRCPFWKRTWANLLRRLVRLHDTAAGSDALRAGSPRNISAKRSAWRSRSRSVTRAGFARAARNGLLEKRNAGLFPQGFVPEEERGVGGQGHHGRRSDAIAALKVPHGALRLALQVDLERGGGRFEHHVVVVHVVGRRRAGDVDLCSGAPVASRPGCGRSRPGSEPCRTCTSEVRQLRGGWSAGCRWSPAGRSRASAAPIAAGLAKWRTARRGCARRRCPCSARRAAIQLDVVGSQAPAPRADCRVRPGSARCAARDCLGRPPAMPPARSRRCPPGH